MWWEIEAVCLDLVFGVWCLYCWSRNKFPASCFLETSCCCSVSQKYKHRDLRRKKNEENYLDLEFIWIIGGGTSLCKQLLVSQITCLVTQKYTHRQRQRMNIGFEKQVYTQEKYMGGKVEEIGTLLLVTLTLTLKGRRIE